VTELLVLSSTHVETAAHTIIIPVMAMENVAQPLNLYQQLDQYDWDADEEFQGGLSAILGPDPAPDQAAELALRARCFFYSR